MLKFRIFRSVNLHSISMFQKVKPLSPPPNGLLIACCHHCWRRPHQPSARTKVAITLMGLIQCLRLLVLFEICQRLSPQVAYLPWSDGDRRFNFSRMMGTFLIMSRFMSWGFLLTIWPLQAPSCISERKMFVLIFFTQRLVIAIFEILLLLTFINHSSALILIIYPADPLYLFSSTSHILIHTLYLTNPLYVPCCSSSSC